MGRICRIGCRLQMLIGRLLGLPELWMKHCGCRRMLMKDRTALIQAVASHSMRSTRAQTTRQERAPMGWSKCKSRHWNGSHSREQDVQIPVQEGRARCLNRTRRHSPQTWTNEGQYSFASLDSRPGNVGCPSWRGRKAVTAARAAFSWLVWTPFHINQSHPCSILAASSHSLNRHRRRQRQFHTGQMVGSLIRGSHLGATWQ